MAIDLSGLITAEDKLQAARQAKRDAITSACNAAIGGGFEYAGRRWDSDVGSRQAITEWQDGGVLPEGFTWRDESNNDVPMDAADMAGLADAARNHVRKCRRKSWELKARADDADMEQLAQIQWPEEA